jgi:hypothetical protein
MKKMITALATVAITLALPIAAFAHGHGGTTQTAAATKYAVCQIEDCALGYTHEHDGASCLPHNASDGHDYHDVCDVKGCAKTTVHTHGDTVCTPHALSDGHGYHQLSKRSHH